MINNNISFQGRTALELDPRKYRKLFDEVSKNYRDLGQENKCHLTNGKVFTATTDNAHFAVIVRNHNNGFLKFVPVKGNFSEIIDDIAFKIDKLKDSAKSKLTAWIIGGDKLEGKCGSQSIETLNKIADVVCDRPDIDASILAGTKNPQENIVIHTLNDVLEMTLEKPKKTSLEDVFDIVEINNTDIV